MDYSLFQKVDYGGFFTLDKGCGPGGKFRGVIIDNNSPENSKDGSNYKYDPYKSSNYGLNYGPNYIPSYDPYAIPNQGPITGPSAGEDYNTLDGPIYGPPTIVNASENINSCDCELHDIVDNQVICPKNKFVNTKYPLIDKVLCCSPCKVKPPLSKDLAEKCSKYGLRECSEENVEGLESDLKKYGLEEQTGESIRNFYNKCDRYGLKYYDRINNRMKNSDSYLECSVDNFNKMDNICKNDGIPQGQCNWYNVHGKNISDLKNDRPSG